MQALYLAAPAVSSSESGYPHRLAASGIALCRGLNTNVAFTAWSSLPCELSQPFAACHCQNATSRRRREAALDLVPTCNWPIR